MAHTENARIGKLTQTGLIFTLLNNYPKTALLHLQQMVLLGLSYRLMPLHDQRDDKSLGVIRTHVSRGAPNWDL